MYFLSSCLPISVWLVLVKLVTLSDGQCELSDAVLIVAALAGWVTRES